MLVLENPLCWPKAQAAGHMPWNCWDLLQICLVQHCLPAGSADRSQALYCVGGPSLGLPLQPGTYSYQYLVDGKWMTSPDAPAGPDDDGHLCNKVRLLPCHFASMLQQTPCTARLCKTA